MSQMLYLIQTGRNLPDVRDLKNVHCWSSLIDLLHCLNVLTNTCTCQPPEYKNLEMFRSLCIRNLHISHYAPYLPPKILHSLCFSFFLGIKAVPRGIENKAHAKCGEQMRCIVIFDNVWILSENHPKAFWMFPMLITACKSRANFLRCVVQFDWLISDQLRYLLNV